MNPTSDTVTVFYHMPKSGGTSLGGILRRNYPPEAIVECGPDTHAFVAEMATWPPERLAAIRLLQGHFPFGLHTMLPRPARCFTLLRDPVERVISYYYHARRDPGHYLHRLIHDNDWSLEALLESRLALMMNDGQVRLLSAVWGEAPFDGVDEGLLATAAENLRAYAVNLANGALLWSYQMYGESAYDSWPVVSETKNVVMFRTKSVYSFHATLGLDDAELFCPGDHDIACGSCANWNPGNYNAPAAANTVTSADTEQWNEQHYVDGDNTIESIDEIFLKYPQRRTFYALNLDTGAHLPAPILWTGGGGRLGIAPVVNETTGNVYVLARTKYSRRDADYFCRKWVDLVRLTFDGSQGTFHFLPCQGGVHCPDSWLLHLIGDETTVLSLAGDRLFGSGWFHTGSVSVANGDYFAVSNWDGPYDDPEGATGSGGDSAAPASIANGRVFVKQHASNSGLITIVTAFRKQ